MELFSPFLLKISSSFSRSMFPLKGAGDNKSNPSLQSKSMVQLLQIQS